MAGGVRRPRVRGVVWWLVKPNKRNLESCCTPMAEAHEPVRESSIPEYASQYGVEYYRNSFLSVGWLLTPNNPNLATCYTPRPDQDEPERESPIPEPASQYGAEYFRNRF